MNTTVEPLIKNRLNEFTNLSGMKFDDVVSMRNAYFYVLDRIHFIYLNNEPVSDRNYSRSILNRDQQHNMTLVHLNYMQTFNILYGVHFKIVSEYGDTYT
jgi:hypothetical protein